MAAPIVAAIAALARALNPDAQRRRRHPRAQADRVAPVRRGWSPELGWGIVNAGAALSAIAAIDRRPPTSKLRGPARVRTARTSKLTLDRPRPARGEAARVRDRATTTSTARPTARAYKRIKRTSSTSLRVRMRAGSRYRFYTIAVDKAGNREAVPPKPDLSTRVG